MFDTKKKALEDLMKNMDETQGNKIKIVIQGNSVEEVKEGLEMAEKKLDEMPEMEETTEEVMEEEMGEGEGEEMEPTTEEKSEVPEKEESPSASIPPEMLKELLAKMRK